jgi:uncharacterized membrane protein
MADPGFMRRKARRDRLDRRLLVIVHLALDVFLVLGLRWLLFLIAVLVAVLGVLVAFLLAVLAFAVILVTIFSISP